MWISDIYYMASIVHALWLAWLPFRVVGKSYQREGEINRIYEKSEIISSITERKILLAYRYFFSISNESRASWCSKLHPVFFIVFFLKIALKRPYNNLLITSSVRSLQGKPQTSALMYSLGQYIKTSVWDFPVNTSPSVIINKWYT